MFNRKGGGKTEATKRYVNSFGIQATIGTLIDVSNYCIDEIYLFSVELFAQEITKFDMKEYAASKEAEAAFERMKLENEAKNM